MEYIYHHKDWPVFYWDSEEILPLLSHVRYAQGKVNGRLSSLGFESKNEAVLEILTNEIIKSNEIEGEYLNLAQVRSSICRKLGIADSGLMPSERNIDGMVDMVFDATIDFDKPLSKEKLFNWHGALFPTGRSGLYKIITANWRNDTSGPMQVLSGSISKSKVHFQAPEAKHINREMNHFFKWYNTAIEIDYVIKAAIAHLWFITIHPFEDGNGRIARAITEQMLTRSDNNPQRFYTMSAQINIDRKYYYEILEKTQKGDLDITHWLKWFLETLQKALISSEMVISKVLFKARFWQQWQNVALNKRQILMINKLLDGFEGKLNSSKWAKIAKCSSDTALRDIQDLIGKNILIQEEAGGRSTSYTIKKD